MQVRSNHTIRLLRWLAVLALLTPALLFAAAAWKDRSTILTAAESDGAKIVALFHEQAGNLFAGHQAILDTIVARVTGLDWETIQARTDLLSELEIMDRRLDDASEILLADATGRIRATTVHPGPNELLPAVDRLCFLILSRHDAESCISQPYNDPAAGHYLFSLSQRLVRDGAFDGIAQVAISADYIVGLWAAATPSASDIVTLFKSDGIVLAQSGPQSPAGPSRPDFGRVLINAIGQTETGVVSTPLLDGEVTRINVFGKVANEPVYIALSLDKGAILKTWYANITVYGLVAASATAGIIMALGIALRRAHSESRAVTRWQTEMEQRLLTQEELRQSQKMESLGKLTGGIAHDFNNLLTVIVGNLAMAEEITPDGKVQQYLHSALSASRSAVQLTTRLLAFARKQVLNPRAVDLVQLIEGMRNLLQRTLESDIRLQVVGDPGVWPALVDPNQLELIVLNLAINARDAMPKGGGQGGVQGGTLTIGAANAEYGPDSPPDLKPGQYVVLTVADTGMGMDAATLARATEPFFSTKEAGKGTGLGLSIMQGIVVQSGGATRLTSQPGRGTRIEMWLPRARVLPSGLLPDTMAGPSRAVDRNGNDDPAVVQFLADALKATRPEGILAEQDPEHDCTGTVLVCDDDPDVLRFVCDALETRGCRALPVASGQAAIAMLKTNKSIDLLVVDFTMPDMNGAAVVKESLENDPDLPILLMTGNADPDAMSDLPDVGMLLKPFDREVLTHRVADMLAAARDDIQYR